MKKMRLSELVTTAMVLGMLAMAVLPAMAGVTDKKLSLLSAQEAAWWDATHVLEVDYTDFVGLTTSTNTTTIITNALPAGTLAKLVLMKLDEAFACATYTDSLLVYSGWAADTDGYVASTEIAADGTEIFAKVTPILLENSPQMGTTNSVTNITYASTWPWQYCTTATNILTTFVQNSHGSCISSNTQGKIRFFYKLVMPGGSN